jgi:hypothetical protein
MIQMPRRNVTRFFIPLIDVLILLFCIFLLMEFNSETEVDKQIEIVAEQSESLDGLQALLERRTKELQQFEDDRPKLKELAKLRKELEELKNLSQQGFKQQWDLRTIDIDAKDGSISFYDDKRPKQPIIKIDNEKSAQDLIARHLKEANGRKVYYYFQYPRGKLARISVTQVEEYHQWFKGPDVDNSLAISSTS